MSIREGENHDIFHYLLMDHMKSRDSSNYNSDTDSDDKYGGTTHASTKHHV